MVFILSTALYLALIYKFSRHTDSLLPFLSLKLYQTNKMLRKWRSQPTTSKAHNLHPNGATKTIAKPRKVGRWVCFEGNKAINQLPKTSDFSELVTTSENYTPYLLQMLMLMSAHTISYPTTHKEWLVY